MRCNRSNNEGNDSFHFNLNIACLNRPIDTTQLSEMPYLTVHITFERKYPSEVYGEEEATL